MKGRTKAWTSLLLLPLLCGGCGGTPTPGGTSVSSQVQSSSLEGEYHTVTFETVGGSKVDSIQVKHGEKATKPDDPTKTGYSFVRWDYDGEEWAFKGYVVTEDMTLKAVWKAVSYTITYKEGTSSNPKKYTIEDEITLVAAKAGSGYTFIGWFDEGGEEVKKIEKGTTGDLVLTAKYSGDPYRLVVENAINGRFDPIDEMKQAGEEIVLQATSSDPEMRFYGWINENVEHDFRDTYVASYDEEYRFTMPTHEVSLVPVFAPKTTVNKIIQDQGQWTYAGPGCYLEGRVVAFTSTDSFYFTDGTSGGLNVVLGNNQSVKEGDKVRVFFNAITANSPKTVYGVNSYKPIEVLEQSSGVEPVQATFTILGLPTGRYYAVWEWNSGGSGHWVKFCHDEIYVAGNVNVGHLWFNLTCQNYLLAWFYPTVGTEPTVDWEYVAGKTKDYSRNSNEHEWVYFSDLQVADNN